MDGESHTSRELLSIKCYEQSTPLDELNPGQCDYGLHLSDAKVAPDGKQVVFSGEGGYEAPTGTLPGSTPFPTQATLEKVYAVDTSGAGLRRVSTAGSGYNPTWSPTGDTVVFTQKVGGTPNLMVSGTAARDGASVLIADASQADWQPIR